MTLVDTSVWIDHLRRPEPKLTELLEVGAVLCHPLVIEELACGSLADRASLLRLLSALPPAPLAEHAEVLGLIERESLHGTGLGAIDAHLLASARLGRMRLWSKDAALVRAAKRLGLAP